MEGTISRAREDAGLKEERLLVFVRVGNSPNKFAVTVLAYNPVTHMWAKGQKWRPSPRGPYQLNPLHYWISNFGISIGSSVLFPGGPILRKEAIVGPNYLSQATTEVWSFEPLLQNWTREAPMQKAHWGPACGRLDQKVIVVGNTVHGYSGSAEILDIPTKQWSSLPKTERPLVQVSGTVAGGRFWVLGRSLDPNSGVLGNQLLSWSNVEER
jgi:hypothetical protein